MREVIHQCPACNARLLISVEVSTIKVEKAEGSTNQPIAILGLRKITDEDRRDILKHKQSLQLTTSKETYARARGLSSQQVAAVIAWSNMPGSRGIRYLKKYSV